MSKVNELRDGAPETATERDRLEAEVRDLHYLLVRYQEQIIDNAEVLESQAKELRDKERKLQDASARRKKDLEDLKTKHRTEIEKLRSQRQQATQELNAARAYIRQLERWHADVLESSTWRAMEPVRWAVRTARRQKKNDPFVPRTIGKD